MGHAPLSILDSLVATARRARVIDEDDRAKLRVVLGDAFALVGMASDTAAARSLRAYASAAPAGPATAFGLSEPVAVDAAVLANAGQMHALLLDDVHGETMVHPGTVVIPVVLALAEELDSTGGEVERALSVGYEVMIAATAVASSFTAPRGFRSVTLFGPLGAAAAAAELLGLDDERLAAALAIAFGNIGGSLQAFRAGSPEWRVQVGVAAQNGLTAARVAATLDDAQLPFPMDAADGATSAYTVVAGVEQDWRARMPAPRRALREVTHKPNSTCGANQVPVGALSVILSRTSIAIDDVERIDIGLARSAYEYPGTEHLGPFTEEGALLSRPLAIAATLFAGGGPLGFEQLRAAIAHPRLTEVMAKVKGRALDDSELAIQQDARVDVTLRDGTVHSASFVDLDPRQLDPDWDTTRARLAAAVPDSAAAVASAIEQLPDISARDLLAPIREGGLR